jgi:hypothetical protein
VAKLGAFLASRGKDKKLKLLAPPFQALGFWGTLRRNWNNRFRRKAAPADGAAALAEHVAASPDAPAR